MEQFESISDHEKKEYIDDQIQYEPNNPAYECVENTTIRKKWLIWSLPSV